MATLDEGCRANSVSNLSVDLQKNQIDCENGLFPKMDFSPYQNVILGVVDFRMVGMTVD